MGKTGTSALQEPLRRMGPAGKLPDAITRTKPLNDHAAWKPDGRSPTHLPLAGASLEALSAASKPASPMVVTFLT